MEEEKFAIGDRKKTGEISYRNEEGKLILAESFRTITDFDSQDYTVETVTSEIEG